MIVGSIQAGQCYAPLKLFFINTTKRIAPTELSAISSVGATRLVDIIIEVSLEVQRTDPLESEQSFYISFGGNSSFTSPFKKCNLLSTLKMGAAQIDFWLGNRSFH
jgi:hypothetical protein